MQTIKGLFEKIFICKTCFSTYIITLSVVGEKEDDLFAGYGHKKDRAYALA